MQHKMSCSHTTIFVSHNIRFFNSKSLLKINSSPYILFSTFGTCYQIDIIASQDKLPFMKYVLPVTVHLNLLSVIKKLLQMSHLLQLTSVLLLLILGLGCKEGAAISLRFCYVYR